MPADQLFTVFIDFVLQSVHLPQLGKAVYFIDRSCLCSIQSKIFLHNGIGTESSKEGSIYYLNFKPEVASLYDEIASAYKEETGVSLRVVTASSSKVLSIGKFDFLCSRTGQVHLLFLPFIGDGDIGQMGMPAPILAPDG